MPNEKNCDYDALRQKLYGEKICSHKRNFFTEGHLFTLGGNNKLFFRSRDIFFRSRGVMSPLRISSVQDLYLYKYCKDISALWREDIPRLPAERRTDILSRRYCSEYLSHRRQIKSSNLIFIYSSRYLCFLDCKRVSYTAKLNLLGARVRSPLPYC